MRKGTRLQLAAVSTALWMVTVLWGCGGGVPNVRIDRGYPDFRLAKTIMGEYHPMRLSVFERTGYAISEDLNEVFVLDLEQRRINKRIPVGTNPMGIVVTPDGRFTLVTNHHSDDISIIENARGEVVRTLSLGNNPCGIALSPDGSRVYVTHHGGNRVSVLSIPSFETLARVEVGTGPMAVAVTPDGLYVFVVNE
ncbi:MAG: hypothetical protein AABY46_06255, partial [Nitrospirota bacterium]